MSLLLQQYYWRNLNNRKKALRNKKLSIEMPVLFQTQTFIGKTSISYLTKTNVTNQEAIQTIFTFGVGSLNA